MSKDAGRPKKENKKNRRVIVRLSNDEYRKLDCLRYSNSKNSSEIIRDALDLYYEMNKYK